MDLDSQVDAGFPRLLKSSRSRNERYLHFYTIACRMRTIAIANGGEHEESDIRAAGGVAACVNLMSSSSYEHLVVTSVRLVGHA